MKQRNVEQQYADLLDLGNERAGKLEESRKAYSLVREAGELGNWIVEKVRMQSALLLLVNSWDSHISSAVLVDWMCGIVVDMMKL